MRGAKWGSIPFDFFAADVIFGGAVGDDAAAKFFAQGVHRGFDGLLLFLLRIVRAEQVELAEGLRLLTEVQRRDGKKTDGIGGFPQLTRKAERRVVDLRSIKCVLWSSVVWREKT